MQDLRVQTVIVALQVLVDGLIIESCVVGIILVQEYVFNDNVLVVETLNKPQERSP